MTADGPPRIPWPPLPPAGDGRTLAAVERLLADLTPGELQWLATWRVRNEIRLRPKVDVNHGIGAEYRPRPASH